MLEREDPVARLGHPARLFGQAGCCDARSGNTAGRPARLQRCRVRDPGSGLLGARCPGSGEPASAAAPSWSRSLVRSTRRRQRRCRPCCSRYSPRTRPSCSDLAAVRFFGSAGPALLITVDPRPPPTTPGRWSPRSRPTGWSSARSPSPASTPSWPSTPPLPPPCQPLRRARNVSRLPRPLPPQPARVGPVARRSPGRAVLLHTSAAGARGRLPPTRPPPNYAITTPGCGGAAPPNAISPGATPRPPRRPAGARRPHSPAVPN